jgi:hypothetical protein
MVEDCERADLAICAVEAYDWDGVSGRLNDWTYEDPRSFTGWNEFRLAANRRVREFAAKLRDRTDRLVTVVIFDRELCERYQRPDQTSHRAGGSDG